MAIRPLGNKPGLDGIRAIGIIAVIGLHAIDRVFPGGYLGVEVFFVLSAFLITSLILRGLDENDGRFRYATFYWRRAFRLGPALILWLALVALPTAVLLGSAENVPVWSAGSLLYVGNFLVVAGVEGGDAYTHVWSLAVEEQFYLLWPLALVALWSTRHRIRPLRRWILAALTLTVIVQVAASAAFDDNYFLLTGHLVPLATGAAVATIYAKWDRARLDAAASGRLLALGCLAAIVVLVGGYDALLPLGALTLQVAASLATGYLILHVSTVTYSPSRRLLTLAPVLWLGRRSYGLYLYHRTLAILIPLLWPGVQLRIAGPVVLIASFLLAEASFRLVESPVQQRGLQWLAARGEGARTGR